VRERALPKRARVFLICERIETSEKRGDEKMQDVFTKKKKKKTSIKKQKHTSEFVPSQKGKGKLRGSGGHQGREGEKV